MACWLKIARFNTCFAKCGYRFRIKLRDMRIWRQNHDIEMKFLALRFEIFYSQKLEDSHLLHSYSSIQTWPIFIWSFSCKHFQKDESKNNPWGCWVSELDKNLLNLLTYDGTTTNKTLSILASKDHGLDLWVENPRNRGGSSWAHHEGVEGWRVSMGCCWCSPFFLSLCFSSLFSYLSPLWFLGLLLVLEWVEREIECCK